jgi:DMSO/TMAO reductase YedYZ molybdopterin-dependent catalytic subunit
MSTPQAAPIRPQKGFGAGAGAALAMIAVMAVLRFSFGVPSIPELLQGAFLRLVPGDLFEFMIHLLGPGAKVLLLVSILEGMVLVGGLLGWLFVRNWRPAAPGAGTLARMAAERNWSGVLYGLLVGVALVVIFFLLYVLGVFNPQPSTSVLLPVSISLILYGLVYGLSLISLLPWTAPVAAPAPKEAPTATIAGADRRDFLRVAGGTALALVGGVGLWGVLTKLLAEPEQAELVAAASGAVPTSTVNPTEAADIATAIVESGGVPRTPVAAAAPATDTPAAVAQQPAATDTPAAGAQEPAATETAVPPTETAIPATEVPAVPTATPFPAVPILSPEITPTENFYITTKNFTDPTVDASKWTLTIKGMVDNPMTLTLDQIKAMPQVKVIHTLECISNTVGGDLIGNGRWTGIRVADLMQQVRPQTGVVDVLFRAADDYSDSVPLSVLMNQDTILAYEMNGQPLQVKHGYPARLLIPGIFGMKNVKWITSMEMVSYDYKGFWQEQGWSDPAPYLTMSRIDYPTEGIVNQKPPYISGIAFAGNRGIKRVEVSVDGGKTWADAQLRRPLGRNTWILWTYPWVPAQAGDTTLVVRATDGTGQVQTNKDQPNYPDGATGYHRVAVKIV